MLLALTAVLTVGALLRLLHLGKKSLWLDEATSVGFARTSWAEFVSIVRTREANMVTYHLLLRAWIQLGTSEWVVRLLSALFSIATLALVYALGARLFGRRVGLAATVLLAVNAFAVRYAQESRGYSLLALLACISTLCFVRAIELPSPNRWVSYAIASTLAVYTHFFAALVIVAQLASLAFLPRRQVAWKQLGTTLVGIGVLLLPLALFFFTAPLRNVDWIPQPTFPKVGGFVLEMLGIGRGGDDISLRAALEAGGFLLLFGTCAVVTSREACSTWSRFGRSTETWRFALLLTWLALPIILVLSTTRIKPLFVDKYFLECLPALSLFLAVGLCRLRRRWLFWTVAVGGIALCLNGVFIYYGRDNEDWRQVTRTILDGGRSRDALLFHPPFLHDPFDYYRERFRGFPAAPIIVDCQQLRDDCLVDSLARRYDRVWLVVSHDPDSGRSFQAALNRSYPAVVERTFVGIHLLLYSVRN